MLVAYLLPKVEATQCISSVGRGEVQLDALPQKNAGIVKIVR
jgi:hypothetical protein